MYGTLYRPFHIAYVNGNNDSINVTKDREDIAKLKDANESKQLIALRNCSLASCENTSLRMWNWQQPKLPPIVIEPIQLQRGMLFGRGVLQLRDGRLLSWSNEPAMFIFDLSNPTCTPVHLIRHNMDKVPARSVDGVVQVSDRWLVSSEMYDLWIWDLSANPIRVVRRIRNDHNERNQTMMRLRNGLFAICPIHKNLYICDLDKGRDVNTLKVPGQDAGFFDWIDNFIQLHDDRIAYCCRNRIYFSTIHGKSPHLTLTLPVTNYVKYMVQLFDGRLVCRSNANVFIYNIVYGTLLYRFTLQEHTRNHRLDVLPNGEFLTYGLFGPLNMTDKTGQHSKSVHRHGYRPVVFSTPDDYRELCNELRLYLDPFLIKDVQTVVAEYI